MTISPTENHSAQPRNSRGTLSPSNGRMNRRQTTLLEIEWSPSRTGLINPVAVFEPVELEGTSVSRASVHNISIMRSLDLGVGDKILVYKANMIIPQISENLTRSGVRDIPETCPACGGATRIQMMNNVETLYCTNPECPAKFMKAFTLFVSRDAMNIDGMSEATLEKFVATASSVSLPIFSVRPLPRRDCGDGRFR